MLCPQVLAVDASSSSFGYKLFYIKTTQIGFLCFCSWYFAMESVCSAACSLRNNDGEPKKKLKKFEALLLIYFHGWGKPVTSFLFYLYIFVLGLKHVALISCRRQRESDEFGHYEKELINLQEYLLLLFWVAFLFPPRQCKSLISWACCTSPFFN